MTPLHLEILIRHRCTPLEYEPQSRTSQEYAQELIGMGLLQDCPGGFGLTSMGDVWLNHVLETPTPTQKWVWEQP